MSIGKKRMPKKPRYQLMTTITFAYKGESFDA